jgi:polygalacturonase
VNRAIAAAAAIGGGAVRFPAGVYACHSIRLKSFVTLYLEPGAAIVAAPAGGYDPAESNAPLEATRILDIIIGTTASSGAKESMTSLF